MQPITREHSESIEIAAPVERVYDTVRQLERMGEWSPENLGGTWAKGDGTTIGDQFEGNNKIGDYEWTATAEITRCDVNQAYCFTVGGLDDPVAEWGYFFEPTEAGTKVTETWTMRRLPPSMVDGPEERIDGRAKMVGDGMAETLAQLKTALES